MHLGRRNAAPAADVARLRRDPAGILPKPEARAAVNPRVGVRSSPKELAHLPVVTCPRRAPVEPPPREVHFVMPGKRPGQLRAASGNATALFFRGFGVRSGDPTRDGRYPPGGFMD